ncbi:ATP-binding protein [Megalodesulfovibrio paquesii]
MHAKELAVECAKGRCLFSRHAQVVEEFGQRCDLPPRSLYHLSLVLDELLTNIAAYGYLDQDRHHVCITLGQEGDQIVLTVEDDALPFNILEAPLPDTSLPPEARAKPVGGLGILLVRRLMDNISYERRHNKNVLTLRKRIHHCQKGEKTHECDNAPAR